MSEQNTGFYVPGLVFVPGIELNRDDFSAILKKNNSRFTGYIYKRTMFMNTMANLIDGFYFIDEFDNIYFTRQ